MALALRPPARSAFRLAPTLALLLAGCATSRSTRPQPRVMGVSEHEFHCARAVMDRASPYRMPLSDAVDDPAALALLEILPPEARRTARAAGLEPLIAQLLATRAPGAPLDGETLLRYDELSLRLHAFTAQVSSLAFETACTRRRLDELVASLDAEEQSRQLMLATSSLVVGASTSTAAGLWDLLGNRATEAPAWTAVGGGIVTAALGAAALLVPERTVPLDHRRNLLRPILEGQDPEHLYPSFVFRMLSVRYPGDQETPRDQILLDVGDIVSRTLPASRQARAFRVLAGDGALYPRALLETRGHVLEVLEIAVAGVARDLELLDRTMVRLFGSLPPIAPRGWP